MFASLASLLPFLASTSFGVQAVALAGGKARLSPREDGQYGIAYSRIHPNGDESLCLTVQGGDPKAGDVVHISQCFGDGDPYESAQTWSIPTLGDNAEIKLSSSQNQDLCLSSGYTEDFGEMSVILADCGESVKWTVHGEQPTPISTLLGETWLCVDAKEDSGQVGGDPYGREKEAQTWECAQENPNQLWTIQELGQPAAWGNSDAGADAPDGTENHEETGSYDLTEFQNQTDGDGHE